MKLWKVLLVNREGEVVCTENLCEKGMDCEDEDCCDSHCITEVKAIFGSSVLLEGE